ALRPRQAPVLGSLYGSIQIKSWKPSQAKPSQAKPSKARQGKARQLQCLGGLPLQWERPQKHQPAKPAATNTRRIGAGQQASDDLRMASPQRKTPPEGGVSSNNP
ncbi:MAG: hypothetical protein ACTIJY_00005, partial [Luteimonas sp.]